MIGQTLGQFRITARLGSGGMGVVYRAFDEKLQRTIALKLVGRDTGTAGEDRVRMVGEARAASGFNHPHICTVYETGEIDGQPYIAMEYVEGSPLSELIPVGGLPLASVVRYGVQIADALAHAHGRGVVHRDLKTPNVVVTPDGRAKVLDFGLARRIPADIATTVTRSSDSVTAPGLIGTLSYMAPEVLVADPADERSDIWAFGVMLFEMATGELPFKGRNEFDLTAAILRGPAQPLPPHVPAMLRAVIQRCLAKERGQRYQLAGEARAALEAIQSDVVTVPVDDVSSRPAPGGRRPWVVALAVIVAAAVPIALWLGRDVRSPWERIASGGHLTLAIASDRPAFDPAISPDGKMLCYGVELENGTTDLFVRRVAGGAPVQLTNDDAREEGPRFSPDSEWIAFSRRESSDGVPETRIVPALGGDPAAIIPRANMPAWAPDGKRLAFLRRTDSGDQELVVAGTDGTGSRVLLKSDSSYPFLRHPAWSPDGREVAIVRGSGGIAGEIWLIPAAGGDPQRALSDPPEVFSESPVYTADGLGLIHSSNRGGATNIWLLSRRGGQLVRLTAGPGPDTSPTVADGGTIGFINSRWRNRLEVHSLRGAPPRTLTTHAPYIWGPSFSPDGQEVAFSRGEVDGSWHVWSIATGGGTPRRITATANGEVYPRYGRDGRFILFHTWGSPRRIGQISRDGGRLQMLDFGDPSVAFPDISPDGRWIAMTRTDPDAERIYVAAAGGGEPRRLTQSPGSVPRWSPDGRSIIFAGNRGYTAGIVQIDADGTNERRLTTTGGWPVWWPDGKQIGYRVIGRTGDQEIHVIPAAGGAARALDIRFNGTNQPFDVSPDGSAIVTSNAVHVSDEIWLMEPRGGR
jgi:serine/threonine protein kinase/Tol biopolymer transport system component